MIFDKTIHSVAPGSSSLHSYRIEANSFRRKHAPTSTIQQPLQPPRENAGGSGGSSLLLLQNRSSANRGWKYSEVPVLQQPLTTAEANSTTDISSILPSPAASGASGSNQVTCIVEFSGTAHSGSNSVNPVFKTLAF